MAPTKHLEQPMPGTTPALPTTTASFAYRSPAAVPASMPTSSTSASPIPPLPASGQPGQPSPEAQATAARTEAALSATPAVYSLPSYSEALVETTSGPGHPTTTESPGPGLPVYSRRQEGH